MVLGHLVIVMEVGSKSLDRGGVDGLKRLNEAHLAEMSLSTVAIGLVDLPSHYEYWPILVLILIGGVDLQFWL